MENDYVVVFITAPSQEVSDQIANALLEARLVACVNIISPIQSLYRWQGKIEREQEYLLLCKTRLEIFESELIPAVHAVHPYEVPEIIAVSIQAGARNYLDWIGTETRQDE